MPPPPSTPISTAHTFQHWHTYTHTHTHNTEFPWTLRSQAPAPPTHTHTHTPQMEWLEDSPDVHQNLEPSAFSGSSFPQGGFWWKCKHSNQPLRSHMWLSKRIFKNHSKTWLCMAVPGNLLRWCGSEWLPLAEFWSSLGYSGRIQGQGAIPTAASSFIHTVECPLKMAKMNFAS